MKLLFDENLSPRLPRALADLYPDSTHVHECGLGSADDAAIWQYAKENGFTIVSKDSDFQDRSILQGHPPKLIWLRGANCSEGLVFLCDSPRPLWLRALKQKGRDRSRPKMRCYDPCESAKIRGERS